MNINAISPINFLNTSKIESIYQNSRTQRKTSNFKEKTKITKNYADTSLKKMNAFSIYSPTSQKKVGAIGSLVDYKI